MINNGTFLPELPTNNAISNDLTYNFLYITTLRALTNQFTLGVQLKEQNMKLHQLY